MNDTFSLHVGQNVDHLRQEVATCVFTHASDRLAQVEEETAGNVLEEDVDEVLDLSARWLLDIAVGTISLNLDDMGMLKALENLNLLLDGLDGFLVSLEELLSQEFQGVALLRVFDGPHKVHFGSVAFTEGAEDFVFFVEDWVVLLFGFLVSVLHFCCVYVNFNYKI